MELMEALIFFGYTNDPVSADKNTETSFFHYNREAPDF
jgi:hypothetical protein